MKPTAPPPDDAAARFVAGLSPGTRVVVRYRITGGFTDALGYLHSVGPQHCTVETKRGLVTVAFADIALAKQVPEPPARRRRTTEH